MTWHVLHAALHVVGEATTHPDSCTLLYAVMGRQTWLLVALLGCVIPELISRCISNKEWAAKEAAKK